MKGALASTRGQRAILAGILMVAVGFRFWGIAWGLHDADVSTRPHPDEWVLYWVFHWFGANHNLNPCPRPGSECFFDWGAVYLYLSYAVHLIMWPIFALLPAGTFGAHADATFAQYTLDGRVTSAIFSSITVVVAYLFGRDAYGRAAGLLAALILALSALPIQLAHFATPDSTSGLLVGLTLLAALRALREPRLRRFVLVGALVGASIGSEYNLVVLVVPAITAWLLCNRRELRWLTAGGVAACVAVMALNPYALVELPAFISAQQHALQIRTVDSAAEYGDRWAAYGPAWQYVIRYALGYGVGVAFTVWLLAGFGWSLIRRRQVDILLLAWIVPYFLLVTVSPAKFMRYSSPLIFPLSLLAARATVEAMRAVRWRLGVPIAGAAVCALMCTAIYDTAYDGLFTSTDPRVAAAGLVLHDSHPGATVSFEQLPNGLVNLPYFLDHSHRQTCFAQFRTDRLRGDDFIMLDDYALEEHPRVTPSQVRRFRAFVSADRTLQVMARIRNEPTFLGFEFPIDASPHDWRYPSHTITIYRSTGTNDQHPAACYPNVEIAVRHLYVSTP